MPLNIFIIKVSDCYTSHHGFFALYTINKTFYMQYLYFFPLKKKEDQNENDIVCLIWNIE